MSQTNQPAKTSILKRIVSHLHSAKDPATDPSPKQKAKGGQASTKPSRSADKKPRATSPEAVPMYENRLARRRYYAGRRGKAVDGGRRKKQLRGEFCGRKLERLIRAGAPLQVVNRMRSEIRGFLDGARFR